MAVINLVFSEVYGPVIEALLSDEDVVTIKARIYTEVRHAYAPVVTVLQLRKELKETLSVIGFTAKLSLPKEGD